MVYFRPFNQKSINSAILLFHFISFHLWEWNPKTFYKKFLIRNHRYKVVFPRWKTWLSRRHRNSSWPSRDSFPGRGGLWRGRTSRQVHRRSIPGLGVESLPPQALLLSLILPLHLLGDLVKQIEPAAGHDCNRWKKVLRRALRSRKSLPSNYK